MIFSFLRFKKESGRGKAGKNNADSINNDDEIISGIPKYPPFLEGLPYATPEQLLKTQQELIDRLKLSCGISDAQYRELLEPMLRRYAAFVHLLPASELHHHRGVGGLLRHGLEVACLAVRASDSIIFSLNDTPSERRNNEPKWRFACCTAGLLHDIGKPITDLNVTSQDGSLEWNPLSENLFDWLKENSLKKYFVHWRPNRHLKHEEAGILGIESVITREVKQYLKLKNKSSIIESVIHAISHTNLDDQLVKLVLKADSDSVERDRLETNYDQTLAMVGIPVERYIFDAMRNLIRSGRWKINEPGGAVMYMENGTFIDWSCYRDVSNYLEQEAIHGIPRSRETVADLIIDSGVGIPNVIGEHRYRYFEIMPDLSPTIKILALKIDSIDRIYSDALPNPLRDLMEQNENINPVLQKIEETEKNDAERNEEISGSEKNIFDSSELNQQNIKIQERDPRKAGSCEQDDVLNEIFDLEINCKAENISEPKNISKTENISELKNITETENVSVTEKIVEPENNSVDSQNISNEHNESSAELTGFLGMAIREKRKQNKTRCPSDNHAGNNIFYGKIANSSDNTKEQTGQKFALAEKKINAVELSDNRLEKIESINEKNNSEKNLNEKKFSKKENNTRRELSEISNHQIYVNWEKIFSCSLYCSDFLRGFFIPVLTHTRDPDNLFINDRGHLILDIRDEKDYRIISAKLSLEHVIEEFDSRRFIMKDGEHRYICLNKKISSEVIMELKNQELELPAFGCEKPGIKKNSENVTCDEYDCHYENVISACPQDVTENLSGAGESNKKNSDEKSENPKFSEIESCINEMIDYISSGDSPYFERVEVLSENRRAVRIEAMEHMISDRHPEIKLINVKRHLRDPRLKLKGLLNITRQKIILESVFVNRDEQ